MMRTSASAGSSRPGPMARAPSAAGVIVIVATLFNAGLAIVNAHGVSISSGTVIASEVVVTAAALLFGIQGHLPAQRVWLTLAGLILVFALANGFGSGGFDPKFIRDVLLIPIFILLGLSSGRRDLIRVILILQVIVVAVMLFEAVRPEDFGHFFSVMSYYISSRGFQAESFWNTDSDLFVSATRPGERFLIEGLGIHRLSSVFLEPVSLGNYCVIVAMVTAALWTSLTRGQRIFILVTEAAILVGCDGRFATVSIAAIVALRFAAPVLPRYSNWFYLPGVLALAALAVAVLALSPIGDDFPSRTAGSIAALSRMRWKDLMGFSTYFAYQVMDSGISYLVYSQSLIGALVIWTFVALGLPQGDRPSAAMAHAVSLYIALNLMISYSVFSIKTAALVWFSYGAIARPMAELRRGVVVPPAVTPKLPIGQPA